MTRADQLTRLRERIFRFAASRIATDRAEDLAQEVLIVLEEKYPHLDRLEDLLPLSLQIMRFKMTAMLRKSHRRGESTSVSVWTSTGETAMTAWVDGAFLGGAVDFGRPGWPVELVSAEWLLPVPTP